MTTKRRDVLKGGAAALLGNWFPVAFDKVAAMQKRWPNPPGAGLVDPVAQESGDRASEKMLLKPKTGEDAPPEPAKYDRLPLEWNKARVKVFFEKLAELDVEAFLVRIR